MNTMSNPVESYASATYYQPADPLYLLLVAFFFFLLGTLMAAGSAWVCSLPRSPANVTAHHLVSALADKNHPIHHHLQAHVQDAISAAVKKVVGVMEDRMGEVIEGHFLNEAVVKALEKEVQALRRDISGLQQHEAGPHSKLRKSLSGLQAPMTEGTSSHTNDDDILSAPSTPPPSFSPISSRSSSPDRHVSDSDSIYGSDSGQPAQPQVEPPVMDKEFDDELAALAGYESDDSGSASELDSDVDAEGETDDELVPPPVQPVPAPAPFVELPGLGNLAKRQIKPLSSLKTKGTRH